LIHLAPRLLVDAAVTRNRKQTVCSRSGQWRLLSGAFTKSG
jgi:hypothetical protein